MKSRRQSPRRAQSEGGGASLRAGATLEVTVERILPGGVGLAHAAGQTVFVALAAPNDRVRVRVESLRGKLAFASIEEILQPSPARVEPPCPYFGRCGGCDFQQLTYPAQLDAKVGIIRDCLRRIARIEPPSEIRITPSPDAWHYRSRARWQYDPVRKLLGYFERGTHHVCDVAACPVAAPAVEERLETLRKLLSEDRLPEDATEFEAVAGDDGVALAPPVELDDEREQTRVIGGERYRFDAGCFFQINHALLEPFVREGLQDAAGDAALDLYSGVGLFTLPLARRFARVTAVEGNSAAADFARRNLADAALTNARVETAAVGEWLARNADALGKVDFMLLDPPRAGAEHETVQSIIRLRPHRISYVSCDPATLARDLRAFTESGYSVASIHAFDMFPQTHHVEMVVHLFGES
jgi:23S rRNA (uracil1939-C5)-methyltransferase